MNRKLPYSAWSPISVFFLVWFSVTGGLLLSGETATVVRFAFVLCGSLCLFAGSRAGWVHPRLAKPSGCWVAALLVLGLLIAMLTPVFLVARDIGRKSAVHRDLRLEGQRLLLYAENHGGSLPPSLGGTGVYQYIDSAEVGDKRESFGRPFIWGTGLSGLRIKEISHPEKVVVAYTANPIGKSHGVLFLSGYSSWRTKQQLDQLLRDRPALIAKAKQLKAKRATSAVRVEP